MLLGKRALFFIPCKDGLDTLLKFGRRQASHFELRSSTGLLRQRKALRYREFRPERCQQRHLHWMLILRSIGHSVQTV